MGLNDRKYMDPKEYKKLISKKKPKVKVEPEQQNKEIKPDVKKSQWKFW